MSGKTQYLNREVVLNIVRKYKMIGLELEIRQMPTVDIDPGKAQWIFTERCNELWTNKCSKCGAPMTTPVGKYAKHCWDCGRMMET